MMSRNTGLSRTVRETVLERDGYRCFRCGVSILDQAYSIHHRRPRGSGGSSDPETNLTANAITLCGTGTTGCHGDIESHRDLSRRLGFLIPNTRSCTPRLVPVLHHTFGHVVLDNNGGWKEADRFVVQDWEERWAA